MRMRKVQDRLRCPECGSTRLVKNGIRWTAKRRRQQRWVCNNCGRNTIKPRGQ